MMKGKKNRYIRILIILIAAMVILFTVQLITGRSQEEPPSLGRLLFVTLITGLCFLPLALFSLFLDRANGASQIMTVREIHLTEQDLKAAVALWIYTQHGAAPEGEVELDVEENGTITGLAHVPG